MRDEGAEEAFRRAFERDPTCNSTRLAKQYGLSSRAARRILGELGAGKSGRRRRIGLVALAVVAALAGIGGGTWAATRSAERPEPTRATRSTAAVALEQDLYRALDARDPARVAEAARQLSAEDESLRLAALRYLAANDGVVEHGQAMLALVDDPSDRVRPSAIQLVGGVPGAEVDSRLVDVLLDAQRPQAERLLACASLERRDAADRLALARRAASALLDPSAAIREVTERLLRGLTGKTVSTANTDASALHAAWQQALAS